MELTSYLTAFSIGLLGSAHCMGMCGGITSALSLSLPDNNRHAIFRLMLGYHLGRIGSYALAGLILGTLGWFLGEINQSFQLALRWLAGGMLIAMGLYISGIWKGLTILEKAGGALWRKIQPAASRLLPVRTFHATLALGAFWGWLPCGLVYSTLIWSASHGNPHQSALLMACFGLGYTACNAIDRPAFQTDQPCYTSQGNPKYCCLYYCFFWPMDATRGSSGFDYEPDFWTLRTLLTILC